MHTHTLLSYRIIELHLSGGDELNVGCRWVETQREYGDTLLLEQFGSKV